MKTQEEKQTKRIEKNSEEIDTNKNQVIQMGITETEGNLISLTESSQRQFQKSNLNTKSNAFPIQNEETKKKSNKKHCIHNNLVNKNMETIPEEKIYEINKAKIHRRHSIKNIDRRIELEPNDLNTDKNPYKNLKIIIIIIAAIILLASASISTYFIIKSKKKFIPNSLEKNVVSIKRDLYEIVQYNDTKTIENIIDVSEDQKTVVNEIIYTNFLVNIYKITKFNEKSLNKRSNEELTDNINLYHSQLLIINMTRTNGTESSFIGGYLGFFSDTSSTENNDNNDNNSSDFEILEIEGDENEKTVIDDDFINKVKNESQVIPAVRFSFFENGTIYETYAPPNLNSFMVSAIDDLISKVIPVISKDSYVSSDNSTNNGRRLSKIKNNFEKLNFLRKMNELGEDEPLRQYEKNENNTILSETQSTGAKIENENTYDFKGSSLETEKKTEVSNSKESIDNIQSSGFANFENDGTLQDDYVYDEENDAISNDDFKDEKQNELDCPFKSFKTNSSSVINFINKTIDKKISNKLFNIISKIEMTPFSGSSKNNKTLRVLNMINIKNKEPYKRDTSNYIKLRSKKDIRRLGANSLLKNIGFVYPIAKINLVGLTINLNAVVTADTKEGYLIVDLVIKVDTSEFKIFEYKKKTDLGIGLTKALTVAKELVEKIKNFVKPLTGKKSEWVESFAKFLNSAASILIKTYDISRSYIKPMEELYNKIKDSAKGLFNKMADLVESCNKELNEVVNKVKNLEYKSINSIISSVKTDYLDFVNIKDKLISVFYGVGNDFINEIKEKISNLENFSVDLLFDLQDQITRSIEIFENFSDLLFNSISNGIINFQQNIFGHIKDFIGEILDKIEFIANALKNNEIMRLVLTEDARTKMYELLMNFRTKINNIVETVIGKIMKEYNDLMSNLNILSIKNEITTKVKGFLDEFIKNSKGLLNNIKSKINCFDKFESYTNLLDSVEDIENDISNVVNYKFDDIFVEPIKNITPNLLVNETVLSLTNDLKNIGDTVVTTVKTEMSELENKICDLGDDFRDKYLLKLAKTYENIKTVFNTERLKKIFPPILTQSQNYVIQIMTDNYNSSENYIDEFIQLSFYIYGKEKYCYRKFKTRGKDDLNNDRFYFHCWDRSYAKNDVKRTIKFEETYASFLEKLPEFLGYCSENLESILKENYINIGKTINEYIEKQFTFDYLEFPENCNNFNYIEKFSAKIDVLKNNITELFSEDVFDQQYSTSINNFLSNNLISKNTELSNKLSSKKETISCLGVDNDESEYDLSVHCSKDGKECVGNIKTPVTIKQDFSKDYIKNNLFYNEINKFIKEVSPVLKEFTDIYSVLNTQIKGFVFGKINDKEKVENLLNNFDAEIVNFIKVFLNSPFIKELYEQHIRGLNKKINNFYNLINKSVKNLGETFVQKQLIGSLTSLLKYPTEIIYRFNQIKTYLINQKDSIIDKIEKIFKESFDKLIVTTHQTILNKITYKINEIENNIPSNFVYAEFTKSRLQLVNTVFNKITNNFNDNKNYFLTEINQINILNKTVSDFFDIKNLTDVFNSTILSLFNQINDNLNNKVTDFFKTFVPLSFSEYNFIIVKLRNSVNYAKNIIKLAKNIIKEKKFDLLSFTELVVEFAKSSDFKASKTLKDIRDFLNELTIEGKNELNYHLQYLKDKIIETFEQSISKDIIENRLNDFADKIFSLSDELVDEYTSKISSFKENIKLTFDKELHTLMNKANIYYFDEAKYNSSFSILKNSIVNKIESVSNYFLNKVSLNESIVDNSTLSYQRYLKKGFIELQNLLLSIQNSYTLKLINVTFDLNELCGKAIESTFDDIYIDLFYTTVEKLNSKFQEFKNYLNNIICEIKEKTISEIEEVYESTYRALKRSSLTYQEYQNYIKMIKCFKENPNNSKCLKVAEGVENYYSKTFAVIEEITELSKEFYYQNLTNFVNYLNNFFGKDSINNIIENAVSGNLNLLKLEFDIDSIKENIQYAAENLMNVCKERMVKEIIKLEEKLKEIIPSNFIESINQFANNEASVYINKINNLLVSNEIIPKISSLTEKVLEVNEFFINLIDQSDSMAEGTKLILSTIFTEVEKKIIEEIDDKINGIIFNKFDKIITQTSSEITNVFSKQLLNNVFRKFLTPEILDVVQNIFNETNFKNILSESYSKSILNSTIYNFKNKIENEINHELKNLTNILNKKSKEISNLLVKKILVKLGDYLTPIKDKLNEFKKEVDNQINKFIYSVTEKPRELFKSFLKETIIPILKKTTKFYDEIQDQLLEKINEKIDDLKEVLPEVLKEFPTIKISNLISNTTDKISEVLDDIRDFIINGIKDFENSILTKINEMFSLRNLEKTKQQYRDLALRETSELSIKEVLNAFKKITSVIDIFKNAISNLKNLKNLLGNFNTFKSVLKHGITHIKDPIENIITKLKSFLTPDKIKQFKEKILKEVTEIILKATFHYDTISEKVTGLVKKVKTYPMELLNDLKDQAKSLIQNIFESLIGKVLKKINPFGISKSKDFGRKVIFSAYFFFFGMSFKFEIAFRYGYEFGINFGITKNLALYIDAYTGGYASIDAVAALSLYILEFGAGIEGLLGRGRIGIVPIISLKKFAVNLDCYFKLEAFSFRAIVLMSYPMVRIQKIKVKLGCFKVTLYMIVVDMVTKTFGTKWITGLYYEKHLLKDY